MRFKFSAFCVDADAARRFAMPGAAFALFAVASSMFA